MDALVDHGEREVIADGPRAVFIVGDLLLEVVRAVGPAPQARMAAGEKQCSALA